MRAALLFAALMALASSALAVPASLAAGVAAVGGETAAVPGVLAGGVAPAVTAGVSGLGAALPPGGSGTDLAAETVNLILARVAFVASTRAFATAARMQHTLALIR